jgi:hypothetical protein
MKVRDISLATALLGGIALGGCLHEDGTHDDALVMERQSDHPTRGNKTRDTDSSTDDGSCTAEPSDPTADGYLAVDEPTRATALTLVAANTREQPLYIGARLRTRIGGKERAIDLAPELVRAGASVKQRVELRELGAIATELELPARIDASLLVYDQDGRFVERVSVDALTVGPDLDEALVPLLREASLSARDLTRLRDTKLKLNIAAVDMGDHGLTIDELLGPDEDAGNHLPNPSYSDANPDENGEFHYRFCFRWPVSFVDAGFGESYGVEPEGAWRARGGRMLIVQHGDTLFDDYLDFEGCTPELTTTDTDDFWFAGFGLARVNGNDIIAKDENGEVDAFVRIVPHAGGSGLKYYTLPATDRSNLLAVTTFTLARFNSMTGDAYVLNNRCRPDGIQCCDCASGGEIWVTRRDRKFLIAHEVGHLLLRHHTGGYVNDCTLEVDPIFTACFSDSSHALTSLEFSSCAAMEGWAHFVGVRAFNDHQDGDEPGAIFQYWGGGGLTVDVEQGPVGGVDRYYETMCGGNQVNSAGRGVELDWLRHWWDYHTDPGPGQKPSLSRMLDEIANSVPWVHNDTYDRLVEGIAGWSGSAQRDRFTQIAADNGVNH